MAGGAQQVSLDAAMLSAVAHLWRNQGRILETSFGGTSMLPSITPGDVLRITCGAPFTNGDVVVYVREDRVVVHRVIRVSQTAVWTCGDANLLPDPPVDAAGILGRVTSSRTAGQWHEVAPGRSRSWMTFLSRLPPGLINLLWRLRWLSARLAAALWKLRPGAASRT